MRAPVTPATTATTITSRLTRIMLARACAVALGVGVGVLGSAGCDNPAAADAAVQDAILASYEANAKGQDEQVLTRLREAANVADATPATRAHAKASLAQAEMDLATESIAKLGAQQITITRLINEIGDLGAQIAAVNQRIAGYRETEPTEVREEVQTRIAEAQGGPGRDVWFEYQGIRVPTLAAVKQEISRLEGEIAQKRDELNALEQNRQQLLQQSDELARRSEQAAGREAVDLFRQSSDLRKQANLLSMDVQRKQTEIDPLERDLVIAQGHQQIAEQAIVQYGQLLEQAETGWAGVQQQIQAQAELARTIVEGDGQVEQDATGAGSSAADGEEADALPPGELPRQTVTMKVGQLTEAMQAAQTHFDQAQQYLNDAIQHFSEAATTAQSAAQTVQARRGDAGDETRQAIDLYVQVVNPAVYRLRQAEAQLTFATLLGSQAATLQARLELVQTLTPVFQTAELSMPEGLASTELEAQVQAAREQAEAAYTAATELYQQAQSAPTASADRKTAAQVGRMFALYGHSQLARMLNDDEAARSLLADARAARDEVANASALPPLPPELRRTPAPPAATQGTPAAGAGQPPAPPQQ